MKKTTFMTTSLYLLAVFLLFIGNAFAAGETVSLNIGALPPGKSITISYDVRVNRNLPLNRNSVTQQGTVSGSNFTGSVSNDPDSVEVDDPTVTSVTGLAPGAGFGSAVEFDGIDDHMVMADGGSLASTSHTIEAWVLLRTVRPSAIIFRTDAALSGFSNALYVNTDGKFVHYADDGTARTVTGTTTAQADRWYHVAGVVGSDGTMRLYVNGTEEGTAVSGVGVLWSGGDRYLVGHEFAEAGLDYFDGRIDEIRIWKAGLSREQITAWMYRSADVGHASFDQAACYRLDEADGATAIDSAGSVDGSLVNMGVTPRVPSTIADLSTNEDAAVVGRFVVSDQDGTSTDGVNLADNLSFEVVGATLGSVGDVSGNTFTFTPDANVNGDAVITYRAYDGTEYSAPASLTVHIMPVADPPSVSPAVTNVNQQSSSGLVISRNPVDGAEITHFRITGISAGTLYQNDGTTRINDGDFITYAQGNAGLRFTPDPGSTVTGAFSVQSSLSDSEDGLGGGTATAAILINNPPVFVGAETTLTVGQDSGPTEVGHLLHVRDTDSGQTETWTEFSAPGHGTLGFSGATAEGGSTDIIPVGSITYTPTPGYAGSDSFTIQVSDGVGSATRTISVSVAPTAVAIPASSISATGFTANWNAVPGATGYSLDVASDSGFNSLVAGYDNRDGGNSTSSAVTGLSAGTTYYYRVRAHIGAIIGSNSNTVSLLTIPAATVGAAATSHSAVGFTANWNAVPSAVGYYLDVATDSGFNNMVAGYGNKDVGNVTSDAVSGLSPGTTYYYRVRAYNGSGTGASSDTIVTRTVPGAATATAAGPFTFTGLNANWQAVTGATGYYLDVAMDSDFTGFVSGYNDLDVGNVTTYPITGLNAATTYYYRVRAYNAAGVGVNSNVIEVFARHTVSPSTSGHGSTEPSDAQPVVQNGSVSFTLLPDTGYHIDSVGGTCSGILDGDVYTTSQITGDCTVVASFAVNTYTVTGSTPGNGTISCTSSVNYGTTGTCTITPDPGYRLSAVTANGNDITGDVVQDRVTIGPVTGDTSVIATFAAATYGGRAITSGSSAIGLYSTAYSQDGTQHLAYERDGNLYYRSSPGLGGTWSTEEMIAAGHDSSMVLGNDGSPVVAFLSGGEIRTATRSEGAWSTPAGTGVTGANSVELAVDGNGALHMVYTVVGSDGYDDILYISNKSGAFGSAETICDGAYASGIWTFCRTPLVKADSSGNYHIVFSKQQINSRIGEHDPQWMIYTSNTGSGVTIASHDLNVGSGTGTPQLLARGSFGYDPDRGYSLVYGNDMEAAGFWFAAHLESGVWTESDSAIAGTLPSQGNDNPAHTRHMVYFTPDGRLSHASLTGGSYSAANELAPSGSLPIVNPIKHSVVYLASDANGVEQLHQVGIDSFALITPEDGDFGAVVPGQTREREFTIHNNGSRTLRADQVRTERPGYTFEIGTDNCTGATLLPGGSCSFTVKTSYQTYPGAVTDTLTVTSDDPLRGTLTLPLSLQVVEPHYPLEITVNGSGSVTASAPGQSDFTCAGGVCSREYDINSPVTLTAQAPVGYTFTGFTFTGDGSSCSRESSCSVTITAATRVTATFARNSYTISTLVNGNGSLSCTSPAGHGDAGICTVTPDEGYRIEGVGGSCGGTLNGTSYTTLPMTASCTVTAVFASATQSTVSVTVGGSGAGAVYSTPAGISCNSGTCSSLFYDATAATLWAVPDANSTFGGWGGACLNLAGPCELTLTGNKNVIADFIAASKVKIGENGFATLSDAYAATGNGSVIKARSVVFMENLTLDGNRRVSLEGGFNAQYDCNSCGGGNTTLHGILTVGKGSLVLENLTIR